MKRLLKKFAIDLSDIMYHERQVELIKPYLNSYDRQRIDTAEAWIRPGEQGGWDAQTSGYSPYRTWKIR